MVGVQSIERAFALLRAVALEPAGVTDLALRIDLPKSTAARLLAALENEGAVERDDASVYRIGASFQDLFGGNSRRALIALARPYLVGLTAEVGESAGLEGYENGWVQFIDQVLPDHDIQIRDWSGESGRAHALPTGLVFLAHLGEQVVRDYAETGLEALTPNTITDEVALRERLTQIRSAGYAWGFEEFAMGINSVAAPVFGPTGIVAALQLHGPTFRFPDPNRTHDIGLVVAAAAERLTDQLHGSRFKK